MMVWRYGEIRPLAKRPDGSGSVTKDGYLTIRLPDHSEANSQGRALEHRVVMSSYLGRALEKDEYVHHRNGIRLDNRIVNLELWVKAQPSGQRVEDLFVHARSIVSRFEPELHKHGDPLVSERVSLDLGPGYVTGDGYFAVKRHGHPNERSDGYVLAHRFVMSDYLGRALFLNERVHHKNGDKLDNRLSNLELWIVSQPPGQRPVDLVAWARRFLSDYSSAA